LGSLNESLLTHYWSNDTWKENREYADGEPFEYTAGNQFRKKDVHVGDTIYGITVSKGDLYVCGKTVVGLVRTKKDAAQRLDPYPARDHLFASKATRMNFYKKVPESVAQRLRCLDAHGSKPLRFVAPGKLDRQTLRGVRELDARSAPLLDSVLPALSAMAEEQKLSPTDNGNSQAGRRGKKGAGFGSPEMNREVERASIRAVKKWYTSRGWRVDDHQKENHGYDLLCVKDNAEEHVEVKGVRGEQPSFPITVGEVKFARKNPTSKIIVVTSALSRKRRLLFYNGTEFDTAFKLNPLAYLARLREERVES
jgi:Domain of unknown function (DUF3883)